MIEVQNVSVHYGQKKVVDNLSFTLGDAELLTLVGPTGCGKTTILQALAGLIPISDGTIKLGSHTVTATKTIAPEKRQVGMVFQKPNPFPKSIYENVAYGLRLQGVNDRSTLDKVVEKSLKGAALWDEVKDRLHESAMGMSGGQQQRLVIARAIAIEPEVLLLDEPASALDPLSTLKIEELIYELKEKYTIVIVTHNMQQAARVSDYTAFMYMGELIEFGATDELFTNPSKKQTEDYITGRYG